MYQSPYLRTITSTCSFVAGVWVRHSSTPVVRASGRELSYILLAGILMCYLVTFALVFRPTDILCSIQRWVGFKLTTFIFDTFLVDICRLNYTLGTPVITAHQHMYLAFIHNATNTRICLTVPITQLTLRRKK